MGRDKHLESSWACVEITEVTEVTEVNLAELMVAVSSCHQYDTGVAGLACTFGALDLCIVKTLLIASRSQR